MSDIENAIAILRDSNKLTQMEKVKKMGINTHVRLVPYDRLSYCENEYAAVETAITALQEKLEREKGCEWCAGDTQWQPDVLDGCSGGYREPKFCTECGKRLKGDQHE